MKFRFAFSFLVLLGLSACTAPLSGLAPDFTLPLSKDPSLSVTLSEISREHPVLLVFWATWCGTCREEIPILNEWSRKQASKGLQVYGINVEESRETVQRFLVNHPMEYPVLLDEKGDVSSQYKVHELPTMILLAKGGKILYYGFRRPENLSQWIT
ncbi:MAG: TlpA family protein disulfide reductase [Candidatus Omnitrophica bacterium]|nr:TlpA family protein disulfide reductase [Candidatus Omnitrophota bacterium]